MIPIRDTYKYIDLRKIMGFFISAEAKGPSHTKIFETIFADYLGNCINAIGFPSARISKIMSNLIAWPPDLLEFYSSRETIPGLSEGIFHCGADLRCVTNLTRDYIDDIIVTSEAISQLKEAPDIKTRLLPPWAYENVQQAALLKITQTKKTRDENLSRANYLAHVLQFALANPVPKFSDEWSPYWSLTYFSNQASNQPFLFETNFDSSKFKTTPYISQDTYIDSLDRILIDGSPSCAVLYGVPGAGKSTIARAYFNKYLRNEQNKQKGKYNEVLCLLYNQSLATTISAFQTKDDFCFQNKDVALAERMYLLRNIGPRTLLIIDNYEFNNSEEETKLLSTLTQLSCHVLITTTYKGLPYESVEVKELSFDEGLKLFKHLATWNESKETMSEIVQLLNGNITLIELFCTQTNNQLYPASQVVFELKRNAADISHGKFEYKKDGKCDSREFTEHLKVLLRIEELSDAEKYILGQLALCPKDGIESWLFIEAISFGDEPINELERKYFIKSSTSGGSRTLSLRNRFIRDFVFTCCRPTLIASRYTINYILRHASYKTAIPTIINAGTPTRCSLVPQKAEFKTLFTYVQYLQEWFCPYDSVRFYLHGCKETAQNWEEKFAACIAHLTAIRPITILADIDVGKLFNKSLRIIDEAQEILDSMEWPGYANWYNYYDLHMARAWIHLFMGLSDSEEAETHLRAAQDLVSKQQQHYGKYSQYILGKLLDIELGFIRIYTLRGQSELAREHHHSICELLRETVWPGAVTAEYLLRGLTELTVTFYRDSYIHDWLDVCEMTRKCVEKRYGKDSVQAQALENDYQKIKSFSFQPEEAESFKAYVSIFDPTNM